MQGELQNKTLFLCLDHARNVVADWVADDNAAQPHSALDYQTPAACAVLGRAVGPAERIRSADHPLLPPRKWAIGTPQLGEWLDEGRGSKQVLQRRKGRRPISG